MKMKFLLIVLVIWSMTGQSLFAQQLVTYSAPDSARRAADFSLKVNGQAVENTDSRDLRWMEIRPIQTALACR